MDGEKIVYFKVRFLFRKVCLFITKRSFGLFLRINFGSGMEKLLNLINVKKIEFPQFFLRGRSQTTFTRFVFF